MRFTFLSLHTAQSFALVFGIFSIKCLPCRRSLPSVMEFLPRFLAFLFRILPTNCRTRFFRNALCVTFFSPCSLLLMLNKIKLLTTATSNIQKNIFLHHFAVFLKKHSFHSSDRPCRLYPCTLCIVILQQVLVWLLNRHWPGYVLHLHTLH